MVVQALEGADDRRGGRVSLHAARAEDELDERVAAPQDVGDVAPHDADGRRHDADPARPARDRALAPLVEEALGRQLRPQRLVAGVEVAGAGGGDRVDVQLVGALRLVDADAAVDDHLHAVGGPHAGADELVAEQRRAHLAAASPSA